MSDNPSHNTNITQNGDRSVAVVAQSGSTVNLQYHQTYSDLSAALGNSASKIGNYHIDRKERDTLLSWIKNSPEPTEENYEKRIAILLGKAGCGKTVIMKDILLALKQDERYRVLAIKSDIFYEGDEHRNLNEIAGLGKPIIEVIHELAVQSKTILIIDQIDALSAVLSSKRKPLAEMLGLIRSASKIPNVRIIASCRPYDFYYDQSFVDLRNCYQVMVEELEEAEIRQTLAQNNLISDKLLAPELLKLLSNPLNLSLYCSILPKNQTPDIRSLTDLYAGLWNEMLDNCPSGADKIVDFLWNFCTLLYEKQTLSVNYNLLPSKWHKVINELISKGIIVKNNKVVQFMHQTLFDYVFARLFFEKQQTLEDMFETKHQGLFVRNHLKQILEYQHTTDLDGFLRNVHTILFDKTDDRFRYKYRFHIRHLVLSILAGFDNYEAEEKSLILENIFPNELYLFHFTNSILTLAGFNLYKEWIDKKGGFFAVGRTLQDYMFTIFSKIMYNRFHETILYVRSLCESRLSVENRKKLITLIERNGKVDFSEDLKFVVQFLDADESSLAFPMLMHANMLNQSEWVIKRLTTCVRKLYEESGKETMLKYHPNISHNIQILYDDLKRHFPLKAYHFGFEVVHSVAEMSLLPSTNDIKTSMAYWTYNHHNTYTADFHEKLVDDMMIYLGKQLTQKSTSLDNISLLDELTTSNLGIMHIVVAEALCEGIVGYSEYAFRYMKENVGRKFVYSTLLYYHIKLFKKWVATNPSRESLSELMAVIKTINPEWEKKPLKYPNRRYPLSRRGYTRAQYYACIPTEILKEFSAEYRFYIQMQHKWDSFENEEPNKVEMHVGYTTLKKEAFDNIEKEADILHTMRAFTEDDLIDFRKPTLTGVSESFAQNAKQYPDKYCALYLKALNDSSIPLKYSIDGIEALMECAYAQTEINNLLCHLIAEVPKRGNLRQPLTNMTICTLAEYYGKNSTHMPDKVYEFVKGVVLHPSSDIDDTDDIDYNLPINRERGRAIDILVTSCYDKEYAEDIIDTLLMIVPEASVTSKVGMLFRMAYLLNVNREKTLRLFLEVTRDRNPNYYRLPVHNANALLYLIRTNFDDLVPYFEAAVQSDVGNDVTANLLFRAWLTGVKKAKEMLMDFADKSVMARVQLIDFVGRHYHKDFVEQMTEVLFHYLVFNDEALGNEYDEIFSSLASWGVDFDTQRFLNKFMKSDICVHCKYRIYEYLKSLAVENPECCLDILSELYAKKAKTYVIEHYELQQITEILIEAYNSVRTYTNDNQSLENAMDLMDKLLKNEDVNYYLDKCLKTLEE